MTIVIKPLTASSDINPFTLAAKGEKRPYSGVPNCMGGVNSRGVVMKYESVEDILNDFYKLRLEMYTKR